MKNGKNDTDKDEDSQIQALEVSLILNLSACMLATEQWEAAKSNCDKALSIQEDNPKALFRRGQALFQIRDYDSSLQDLHRACALQPDDKKIHQEFAKVKKAKFELTQKEKNIYSKMFK